MAPPPLLDRIGIPKALVFGYIGLLLFMIGDGVESGFSRRTWRPRRRHRDPRVVLITVYGVAAARRLALRRPVRPVGPAPGDVGRAGASGRLPVLFLTAAVPMNSYPLMMVGYGLRGLGYPLFAFGFLVWIAGVAPGPASVRPWAGSRFAFTGGLPTLGSLVASASSRSSAPTAPCGPRSAWSPAAA